MTSTQRLTNEEMAAWRVNLLSWRLIDQALEQQLQRDSGMPHTYYAILVALNEQGDHSLPLTRLAEAIEYSQSRMSHAIAKLEDTGWVERVPDATDKRVSALRLTSTGRQAYRDASRGHIAEVRRVFFEQLDERDLDDLRRIGLKLLDGLTDDLPDARAFGTSRGGRA